MDIGGCDVTSLQQYFDGFKGWRFLMISHSLCVEASED
jgi:hypothetical protein